MSFRDIYDSIVKEYHSFVEGTEDIRKICAVLVLVGTLLSGAEYLWDRRCIRERKDRMISVRMVDNSKNRGNLSDILEFENFENCSWRNDNHWLPPTLVQMQEVIFHYNPGRMTITKVKNCAIPLRDISYSKGEMLLLPDLNGDGQVYSGISPRPYFSIRMRSDSDMHSLEKAAAMEGIYPENKSYQSAIASLNPQKRFGEGNEFKLEFKKGEIITLPDFNFDGKVYEGKTE